MIRLAAGVGIMRDGKVLLAQREDFEVWCLPGGMVDVGESLAETAVREAREETGLTVAVTHLVGTYSEIGAWSDIHVALFAAQPVAGDLVPQADEVLALRYFALDALPADMFWWHRQMVADLFAGVGGSAAWRQNVMAQPGASTRSELYALREASGMSRSEFYHWYYESLGAYDIERQA